MGQLTHPLKATRQGSLLLDVGSTSIKWAVCDADGQRGAEQRQTFPPPLRSDAPYFEIDPDAIMAIVDSALAEAGSVACIAMAVQMHGYLLADAQGQLLTPYISWQDQRATQIDLSGIAILPETGSAHKANLPVLSLLAMEAQQPTLYARARTFFTLGSYIAWRLTGRNATHITDGAASGFFNARTANRLMPQHPALSLPECTRAFEPIGKHKDAAVYSPVGDQQASVMGSPLADDQYLLNLGTAAQLCTLARHPKGNGFEHRPWFDDRTLCTVTGLPGGRELAAGADHHTLAAAWADAVAALPDRQQILVIGGAANHHDATVASALEKLGMPYTMHTASDALGGLDRLLTAKDTR